MPETTVVTPRRCTTCLFMLERYYLSTNTGNRFCSKCWAEIHPPGSEGFKQAIFITDGKEPIMDISARQEFWRQGEIQHKHEAVHVKECSVCHGFKEEGEYAGADFICANCIQEDGEVDVNGAAVIHFRAKVRGSTKAIDFFNFVMKDLDKDWPGFDAGKVCPVCNGVEWRMPMLKVDEVKKLADDCGIGKIKIKYWGDAAHCFGGGVA